MEKKKRSRLPREFWAVNASNLFERGAYYGMLAVFSYHLVNNVGIESWMVGILSGISMGLINFLPLISTAIASKYGFKKILLFSYITLGVGYITLGFGYSIALIFLAVIIMGLGSGFEKALIAASISHSSNEKNRNFAFYIYYFVINIGAFAIPLSLTFLFLPENYASVFFLMAFFILCSFLIILLSYKNPVKPDPSIPTFDAIKNLKVIFKDPKFVYVLIIFAGCWFMLYTRKLFTPLFMTDFKILDAWFIPIIAALNPGTIITLGPVWANIIKDRNIDSLKLLIAGVLIIAAGFFILGITLSPAVFLAGIILVSFGEMVSYPAYLSYVSKIPPKDKRSIYMGYSFLPLAIAGVTASVVGGFLYYIVGESMAMGKLFWAIIASIGFVSASAFLLYDRHYNKAKKIRKFTTFLPVLFIPLILVFAYSLGPDPIYRGALAQEDFEDDLEPIDTISYLNKTYYFSKELDEKSSVKYDLFVEDMQIEQIELTLKWSDEDDIRRIRKFENNGDTFSVKIIVNDRVVNSQKVKNLHGEQGVINLEYNSDNSNDEIYVAYVEVGLIECGDFYPAFGGKLITIKDESNIFNLDVDVTYRDYA
jgi:dipeptide/tripeptide permease